MNSDRNLHQTTIARPGDGTQLGERLIEAQSEGTHQPAAQPYRTVDYVASSAEQITRHLLVGSTAPSAISIATQAIPPLRPFGAVALLVVLFISFAASSSPVEVIATGARRYKMSSKSYWIVIGLLLSLFISMPSWQHLFYAERWSNSPNPTSIEDQ